MALSGRTEVTFEKVIGTKSDKGAVFLSDTPFGQNFNGGRKIVVTDAVPKKLKART